MNRELQEKWDRRHAQAADNGRVSRVLEENLHLLPPEGTALDLACGRGADSLCLARAGLRVTAWDLSPVAIDRLRREAARLGLPVTAGVRDLIRRPPEPESFDLILVSHFLHRPLAPAITAALHPGGLLYYQTFSRLAVSDRGPRAAEYRLAEGELLSLFSGLQPRVYREEGRLGDLQRGCRDIVMLVARKA